MSRRGSEVRDKARQRRLGNPAFTEYSEEQWGQIKQSLAKVGISPANDALCDIQYQAMRHLAVAHLRDAPDWCLRVVCLKPTPTQQQAANLREEIAKTDTSVRVLSNLLERLKAERTELQQRLDALVVEDPQDRSSNAQQYYTYFWIVLTEKWLTLVPAATARPQWRQHLLLFLHACSSPVFPKATADKALMSFIDRYFRKRQADTPGF
jgi:hypothetical protein